MPLAKDKETAENLKTTMLCLEEYFESQGQNFHMHLVTKEKYELLEQLESEKEKAEVYEEERCSEV